MEAFMSKLFFIAFAFLIGSVFTSITAFATETYEVRCKGNDCFKNGWTMTGQAGSLDTVCKRNDCAKYGWRADVSDGSVYQVRCKGEGKTRSCFDKGWFSKQDFAYWSLED